MTPGPVLSVVIPAYNEQDAIGPLLERVKKVRGELQQLWPLTEVEVIVVDDGSNDHTSKIAAQHSWVRLICHSSNQGYGAALKTGFRMARGEYIAFLDADGTYPPESLGSLFKPVIEGQADMTVGTRNLGRRSSMPVLRRLGNFLFAKFLTWIAEVTVSDSASGLRVFRKSIVPCLLPLPDGLDFIVGLSTRALYEGLKVVEVPIPYAERQGRSKLNILKDGFRFLRTVIMVGTTYNPLKFFGFLGLFSLAVAFYLGIGPLLYYLNYWRVEDWEIYRLFTILVLGVIGLQLIHFGIIGNRILAMITGQPAETCSLVGKLFLNRGFSRMSWKVGGICCTAAVLLNYQTIFQYLSLKAIFVHWSYILTGATLFLLGAQLLMIGGLLSIFQRIEERQAYLRASEVRCKQGQQAEDQYETGATV